MKRKLLFGEVSSLNLDGNRFTEAFLGLFLLRKALKEVLSGHLGAPHGVALGGGGGADGEQPGAGLLWPDAAHSGHQNQCGGLKEGERKASIWEEDMEKEMKRASEMK